MHVRDVAHEDGPAVDLLDRKPVDRLDDVGAVVHRQRVVLAADLDVAGRQDDVLALQRLAHIGRRQAARLQRALIEIRHDDARLAAIGIGNLGAVHDRESRAG